MIKFANRRSAAMMTSASVLVLGALVPVAAQAQQTDVGGPGQALTTGTVSTTSGTVTDGGLNNGVLVITGSTPLVVATDATVDTRPTPGTTALDIGTSNGATGPITVNLVGVNSLQSSGSALVVSGVSQATTVNLGSGNTLASATQQGLNANTQGGDLIVNNGANTITSASSIGLSGAVAAPTGNLIINSTGGTVSGSFGAINGTTQGGSVVIGQGAGITSAITQTNANANFIGIGATVQGAGAVTIRTGAGGTVNGQGTGIQANANGIGAATVNVGGAVGATTAPVTGVRAISAGGDVVINTTAAVSATGIALVATTAGAGGVTVTSSAGATLTGPRAVVATTQGGAISATLAGQTNGAVYTQVTGAGGITVNATGISTSSESAILASVTGGPVNLTTTGTINGAQGGLYITSSGAGATSILASGAVNGGTQSGIDSRNTGSGSSTIGTAAQRTATVTGGINGIFTTSSGSLSVYAGQVTGGTRGIVAASQGTNPNGTTLVDVSGRVTANSGNGIVANNNGVLVGNTVTLRAADVVSTGGSAVSTFSNRGDTTITTGALTSSFGNNNGWTTVFGQSNANINLTVNGALNASFRGIDLESGGIGATGALTINAGSAINGFEGIRAVSTGSAGINIGQTTRTGAITTTNGAGIFASGAGDVNIAAGAVTSVGGTAAAITNGQVTNASADTGFGIAALSSGGSININATGTVTGGAAGGVLAQDSAATGGVTITTANVVSNASGTRGVAATTVGGPITIGVMGSVQSSGTGVFARGAGDGAISVGVSGTTTSDAIGIDVSNTGVGATSIGSAGQRLGSVTGNGSFGINASVGGDLNIYSTAVTGATRGIQAMANGDNGAIVIDVAGLLTSRNGTGVFAYNSGTTAASTVDVRLQDVSAMGATGVSVGSSAGNVRVSTGAVTSAATVANPQGAFNGIAASANGGGNVSVVSTGPITAGLRGAAIQSTGATATGGVLSFDSASTVQAQQGVFLGSEGAGGINVGQATRIGAITATNGVGVLAMGGGNVNIAVSSVSSSGGTGATIVNNSVTDAGLTSGFGIAALSSGGSININASGLVTGGAAGGVLAQTTAATGGVTINTAGVTAGAGRGIGVTTVAGPITIAATGPINAQSFGIQAVNNGAGAINVLASGTVNSSAANGIAVQNNGLGAVTVGAANNRIGAVTANGATGTGITAFGAGDVSVYASSVSGGTRGIVAANQYANPNGRVIIDVTGPVVGLNSWGIIGINNGTLSSNSLSITTGDVTGTGRTAISAQTVGGDITILTNGTILSRASQTLTSNSSVFAESQGNGLINIDTLGTVTGYDGIYALSDGTAGGIDIFSASAVTGTNQYGIYGRSGGGNVLIEAQGPVSGAIGGVVGLVSGTGTLGIRTAGVTSTSGPGVLGQSATGAVTISTGAVTAVGGTGVTYQTSGSRNVLDASVTSGFGVLGLSSGGNINLTSTGLVTGGAAGGVYAQTTGAGTIGVNAAAVTAAIGRGIEAYAAGGAITIAASGPVNSAGTGIEANNSGAGSIAITSSSTVVSGAGANAIDAANLGTGFTTVGSTAQRLGAVTAGATGIFATSQGNVSVTASSVTGGTRGIVAASQGAAPNGVVSVNTSGAVTAASGFGIVAVNNGSLAANTLSITAAGPVTSTGGSAISAQTVGGDVTINAAAVSAASGNNSNWDAIFADGRGDSLISIATTGAASGSFHGIEANSTGTTVRSGITINAGGNVTAGSGNSAILANVNGLGNIAVNTATGSQLNAASGYGISVNVAATPGNNNITIANQAAIGGTGPAQVLQGIHAQILDTDNAGNIAITSTGGAIRATNAGIFAYTTGTGSIDIGGLNGISSAITTGNVAIVGSAASGAVNIRTASAGTIAGGGNFGIQALTTTGAITINQAGAIGSTASTVANGIYASIASGTASLTINSTGGIYVSPGTGLQSAGIYAVHGGTGAVSVTSTGVIDPGAYGVVVQGGGAVSYAANGGLVEGGQGAYVASTGGGTVTVTSAAGTPITGLNGVGLQTVGTGGAVSVATAGAITGSTSGLVSSNTGTGSTTIATTGAVTGQTGDGVNVSGSAGVTTVTAAGPVSGANSGIVATSTGAGSTVVTNTGAVTSQSGPAINAQSGTGGLTINVRGNVISATGPAIQATSAAGGVINVAAGSTVAGRVDTPTEAVILLNTASGSTSTINVAQGATVQAVSGSPFTTAIRAEGGSVVVNNMGNVNGQIDFSALTGTNTGSLAGGAGTTFQTGGLSTFGAGNDTYTNAGQLVTVGAVTTFDFRGGTNIFNNSGTVFVGSSPVSSAGSIFQLLGLTTLNNTGTINLMNGVVGDRLIAPGSAYVGSGAARLLLDVAVGGPASGSDQVAFGTTSGRTSILVRDTVPTTFGAYNPTGTVLVSGQTHAGDFVLDTASSFYNAAQMGGAIDKPGLFFSQLAVNGSGATVLVSLPKVEAYQFSTIATQAQAVWFATGARSGRQAEVRDQVAAGERAGGAWIEVQGSHGVRSVDRNLASLGGLTAYDAAYSQDITGVTVGADTVLASMGGDVIVGGSVGYVNSDADFDKHQTAIKMDGYEASVYATFARNDWFVSGAVGGSQLNADLEAPRLAGFSSASTDVSTFGATLEGGFRAPFLMGTTIEPTAALAYADTTVDDLTIAGSTFEFGQSNSLRPSIGARVSGQAGTPGGWATRYNVSLRGVGEVLGANQVDLRSGGPVANLDDVHDLGYGEMKAGLVSQSAGGWTVFADVTGRYGDAYKDVGASIGFRVRY